MDELEDTQIRVNTGQQELIVSRDKLASFLPLLGAEVDNENYIRDIETQTRWETPDGKTLPIDEVGYLGVGDDGDKLIIEDSFPAIVSYLSERDIREE